MPTQRTMHYARVYSAQTSLLKPHTVSVEIDLKLGGMPSFTVVGLPDKAVEEARDRVASAIKHAGFESPKEGAKKIVVALAPADLKKEGPMFDLSIALAYLLAMGEVSFDPEPYLFIGELSLNGRLRGVRGVLPLVAHAKKTGRRAVFVPRENEREAALVPNMEVYGANTLRELVSYLNENDDAPKNFSLAPAPRTTPDEPLQEAPFSFEDVRGQENAKRAAVIAAGGGHNLGLYGPPGTGKTMLARAFASILPQLTFSEMLEVNGIHSVAGLLTETLLSRPPLRSPHHTSSYVSMVGGGSSVHPGEATLAHRGVLFMDEFPEFDRRVIEALRQPLEDRTISISRSKGSALFPARFTLIAAMNPCPCGNFGHPEIPCTCTPMQLERYRRKVSGPIADRIDLWAHMGPVELAELGKRESGGTQTRGARRSVALARERQRERFNRLFPNEAIQKLNSELTPRELDALEPECSPARGVLAQAAAKYHLSPRGYHRTLKVARTIADLEEAETIAASHVLEALQYRKQDF